MKKLEFTVLGEPLVGGSLDVDATATIDDDGPFPIALPVLLNDQLLHMPAIDGVARIHLEFPTPGVTTLGPGDDFEGETLVLRADRTV
ncbi:MAG TPA: hypothetical protein VN605_02170 [Thermoanaerobaculia bacterium]|nr:hypothetical protein [Thermoanaerobaculia bacterium]